MNVTAIQELIISNIVLFGVSAAAILGMIITLVVGLLVFRWGAGKLARSTGEPSYMQSYNGIDLAGVSTRVRKAIRESYPKNTEGI